MLHELVDRIRALSGVTVFVISLVGYGYAIAICPLVLVGARYLGTRVTGTTAGAQRCAAAVWFTLMFLSAILALFFVITAYGYGGHQHLAVRKLPIPFIVALVVGWWLRKFARSGTL
jgi:hypothetical protein